MNEKPILFSGSMVRAILNDYKCQTRRVIKPQPPHWRWNHYSWDERCINVASDDDKDGYYVICPYGKPGDRLWVRETWAHDDVYCKDIRCGNIDHIWWKANEEQFGTANSFAGNARWHPSIHMPRWASRITLEIVKIRVEKLQDIAKDENVEDIFEEGLPKHAYYEFADNEPTDINVEEALEDFQDLWNSINAQRGYGWDHNPWVWVIEFKEVEA